MSNTSIVIGEIRQGLKLIEKLDKRLFKCLCLKCNNEHIIRREKFGRDKSCGCERTSLGKENPLFKGHEGIHLAKWNTYIRNAQTRNIEFSISIEYAWSVYLNQNKVCSLTKEPIHFWATSTKKESTASLDRINNSLGYIEGNIHWVHKKINQIKMDMDLSEFIHLCNKVAINN